MAEFCCTHLHLYSSSGQAKPCLNGVHGFVSSNQVAVTEHTAYLKCTSWLTEDNQLQNWNIYLLTKVPIINHSPFVIERHYLLLFFISEPIDLYSTAQCFEFNEISLKCCAIQNNLVFQTHAHSTDSIHINMCAKVKVPMKRVLEPLK